MFKHSKSFGKKFLRNYIEFSDKSKPKGLKDLKDQLKEPKEKLIPQFITKDFDTTDMFTPFGQQNVNYVEPIVHYRENDVKVTNLPNGLRVGTIDTHSRTGNITIIFKTGPRFETPSERGLSAILNKMSFKSSENFTNEQLEMAQDKIMFHSEVDSENLNYHITFYRENLENAIQVLADTILRPLFLQKDLDLVLNNLNVTYEEQYLNPVMSTVNSDLMFQACFGKEGLGQKQLYVKKDATREELFNYLKKYIRADRCAIVGVNVDNEKFLNLVEKYFTFKNVKEEISKVESKWIGGESRYEYTDTPFEVMKQNIPELTSVSISFKGSAVNDKDIYTAHVLETLLGGGDSFSAGGPGKGLMSVIHKRYLAYYDFYSMKCEHKALSDIGIFTISASAFHDQAGKLTSPIIELYSQMFSDVTYEDVESAKNRFKTMILQTLEDNQGLATNLCLDVLYLGRARSAYNLIEKIDAVTINDIITYQKKIFQSKPAFTVIGNVKKVIAYAPVEKYFSGIKK